MSKKTCIDFGAAVESAAVGNPEQNVYLLLDPAGLPGVSRELRKRLVHGVTLFDDTKDKSAIAVAPILVLAGTNGKVAVARRLLHWFSEYASDTSSVMLMVSPLTLGVMRTRLSARLDVRLSEGLKVLLRFYDPRVFGVIINILDEASTNKFLGVASSWVYPNRSGQLETLRTNFENNDGFAPPLEMDPKQELALLEASEIDQVLDLLRTIVPSKMNQLSNSEQYFFVNDLMMKAQGDGIKSVLAYAIFVSMFLSNGPAVVDAPVWASFVSELRNDALNMAKLSLFIEDMSLKPA